MRYLLKGKGLAAPSGAVSSGVANCGSRGYTIVEMLIVLFITAVVAVSIYTVYNSYFRQATIQDMSLEAQQNARVAVNMMERELINAGYAANTADILTEATANSIEFIYSDPELDPTMSPTAGLRLKVRYALQTTGGVQYLIRDAGICANAACDAYSNTRQPEMVIPYVNNLAITYYDINGGTIADTSTQANRNTVKFVSVALATETKGNIPGTTSKKTFMVETHVRLRNIGIGQTATDTSPPAAPVSIQVRDPGLCGRLKVKWALNTEGDVAGYKVYYGTATGTYTGVINIPLTVLSGAGYTCSEVGTSMECTISPANPPLAYTPSTAAPGTGTVHYLAVKAYDNSLNHSDFSAEVSGNPDPSNSVFDTGSDDSVINPVKPVAVTGLTGADGPGGDQVQLSWTAYNTASNPDVVGFRVYRSESPFTSYPIVAGPGIEWIAGEPGSGKPEIDPADTSYLDSDASLIGCRTYYYAIAPVNCDPTLVTDDTGADPDPKKYVQTDYNATCGDGTAACTPGTGFAAITGSDTAPMEFTPTLAPTISVRAGWKRVAVSLTQPGDADLAQTCVYSNENPTPPASYPALQTDTVTYPKASGCFQVDNLTTPGAIRLYESGGIFTVGELAQNQSTSFWHNSMTSLTSTPELLDTGIYSYRAVSFDLCGNASPIAAAQDATTLCGEDPAGKPPAVASVTPAGCASTINLSWPGISSDLGQPSSATNPYDLAGYRIFRSTTSGDWSGAVNLTSGAPYWGTSYNDTTMTEGGTYYYRVVTTDCPYEKGDDTGGAPPSDAQIRSHMITGFLNSAMSAAVYPGRIDRDESCPGAGSCTKDDHRAVLTGVQIDNTSGNGTATISPRSSYRHNRVTLFFNNTSAGTMTIYRASVAWVNSSAFLRKITIGGGRSGVGEQSTDLAAGLTTSITGNPPYTSAVANAALTAVQIPAGARYVPITFEFKDAADTSAVDMREDKLLMSLDVRNDSTGTTTCATYLTVSQNPEGVFVPFGPSVTAAQQDRPSAPTFGFAVPGPTGLNTVPNGSDGTVVVDSGFSVTVSANITGNTTDASTGAKVPVTSAKVFYKATLKTETTPPTSGFTQVAMTNTGGNTWSGTIPANDDMRVWYYIVGEDADGNFDRDPEIDHGAYVYDQKPFSVCSVTPSAPTGLATSVSGPDVTLNWTAPATYTNGATINTALDTIKYRVFRNGVQIATDIAATSYTDAGRPAGVYTYTVRATNSCTAPGPNVSSDSNVDGECVGFSSQAYITASPSTIYRGQSYTVTIIDCLAIDSTYGYHLTQEVINSTPGFTGFSNTSTAPLTGTINPYNPTITESGPATATFTRTITTTGSASDTGKLLVLPTDTVTVYYPYASPTTRTVNVIVDPCTDTPNAPTGLTGSVQGQNMTLSWTGVTQNTDGSAITDLAGYRVYEKVCANGKPNCTGADIVRDWFHRTTVTSGTTTTVNADQGNVSQRIYYFRVTAVDSCSTPQESAASGTWNE